MPYAKIQQMGILFNNLPLDIKGEIGVIPRKPSLYGSSQRRKLWLTRHDWSFAISLPGPSSDSCITPTAITHTSTSHTPAPSFCNSSTSSSPPGLSQRPFYITNHLFIAIHLNITIHTSYQHAIHYTSFSPDTCHSLSAPLVRCLSSPSTNVKPSHVSALVRVQQSSSHTSSCCVYSSFATTATVSVDQSTSHTSAVPLGLLIHALYLISLNTAPHRLLVLSFPKVLPVCLFLAF